MLYLFPKEIIGVLTFKKAPHVTYTYTYMYAQ